MYHISSEVGLSPLHTAQSSSELITGHVTCKARLGTTIEKKTKCVAEIHCYGTAETRIGVCCDKY